MWYLLAKIAYVSFLLYSVACFTCAAALFGWLPVFPGALLKLCIGLTWNSTQALRKLIPGLTSYGQRAFVLSLLCFLLAQAIKFPVEVSPFTVLTFFPYCLLKAVQGFSLLNLHLLMIFLAIRIGFSILGIAALQPTFRLLPIWILPFSNRKAPYPDSAMELLMKVCLSYVLFALLLQLSQQNLALLCHSVA